MAIASQKMTLEAYLNYDDEDGTGGECKSERSGCKLVYPPAVLTK